MVTTNHISYFRIPPDTNGDDLSLAIQPLWTTLSMNQSRFESSKSLDERTNLDDRCVVCSGTKKSLCSKECVRAVSVDIERCRCDSPTLISFNDCSRRSSVGHHVPTRRRSLSAENFPLLMKEATTGWRKSLTNLLDISS